MNRVDDAERLAMPPEQKRLPVVRSPTTRTGSRSRSRPQRGRRTRARGRTSTVRLVATARFAPIRTRNGARDEQVERGSRRRDPAEDIRLSELVEPQGIGEDSRSRIHDQQRHTQDDHHDGGAATRPEDERPVVRGVVGVLGDFGGGGVGLGERRHAGACWPGTPPRRGPGEGPRRLPPAGRPARGPVRRCPSSRPFCERKASTPSRLGTQT